MITLSRGITISSKPMVICRHAVGIRSDCSTLWTGYFTRTEESSVIFPEREVIIDLKAADPVRVTATINLNDFELSVSNSGKPISPKK